MALAKTSLNIDLLTVATLYNRGSVVSSDIAYVPVVSTFGSFSKWDNVPIKDLFSPVFYSYSNGDIFLNNISSINDINNLISSSVHLPPDILSTFLSTNYTSLILSQNIGISTLSSFNQILILNSTLVLSNYESINESFSSITPGISTTYTTFYNTLFSPQVSTLIQQGIYYYINRNRIGEFTYSDKNQDPLFGGVFGSNTPLPWFWSNAAPRYVGPGLSSMVDLAGDYTNNTPIYTNIYINFPYILSSISSGLYDSNASLDSFRINIVETVANTSNYIDGGSSISSLYTDFSSTFISTLEYASTVGPNVSTYSTYICEKLSTTTAPTVNGYTIPQYISTADTTINIQQNLLNFILYSTISQPTILVRPYTVFSTIVNSSLSTSLSSVQSVDAFPGLFKISTIAFSTFIPFYALIDASTNYVAYKSISANQSLIFNTFSTNLPYIIGSNTINELSTINSKISSVSTLFSDNKNTLYSLTLPFITSPGVSSMYQELSTNTSVSYIDYSKTISTILLPFNAAILNINAAPGISTLYSTGTFLNSTIFGYISSITRYLSSGFDKEYTEILSTNKSIIIQINNNIADFISAGISSYNNSYSTFGYVSSIPFPYTSYISSQTGVVGNSGQNTGKIYTYLNELTALEAEFLQDLAPFAESTIYYQPIPIITNYSTSLYAKGDILPRYLSRSTFFYSISTLSSLQSWFSSATIQEMGIQTSISNEFNLNVIGSASILPYSGVVLSNPSLLLPNIQIFAANSSHPTYFMQTINVSSSTICFNNSNLILKRVYEHNKYAYIGINTAVDPSYSLDIGFGDARKPTGVTWVTASDSRVKQNISTADYNLAAEQISSLRLVSYIWSEPYRSQRHLRSDRILGFLSQEVELIFPSSVSHMAEYGYEDFKSLDVDQLYMAKYMVTRGLLEKVKNLQARLNALMKES